MRFIAYWDRGKQHANCFAVLEMRECCAGFRDGSGMLMVYAV